MVINRARENRFRKKQNPETIQKTEQSQYGCSK